AVPEVPVLRLVVKQVHPQNGPQTPAQHRREKQRFFRDAPLVPPGPALVQAHEEKGGEIHQQQIAQQQLERFFGHGSTSSGAFAPRQKKTPLRQTAGAGFRCMLLYSLWGKNASEQAIQLGRESEALQKL